MEEKLRIALMALKAIALKGEVGQDPVRASWLSNTARDALIKIDEVLEENK